MDTKSLEVDADYSVGHASRPTWLEDDDSDDEDDRENIHRRACIECLRQAKVVLTIKDAGLDAALLRDMQEQSDHGMNDGATAGAAASAAAGAAADGKGKGKSRNDSDSDEEDEERRRGVHVTTDLEDRQTTTEETMGHVSFDVLPLLRKALPGGDGTRLMERGVKHKWVKLVQTKTTMIKKVSGGGRGRGRKKKNGGGGVSGSSSTSSSAARLATSVGANDSDFDEDDEENESSRGLFDEVDSDDGDSVPIKVHKSAGEICVSVVLVSEREVVSTSVSRSGGSDGNVDGIVEIEEDDLLERANSRRSTSPRSGRVSPGGPSSITMDGSPSSSGLRRHGVHRGFGDQDFHYAASRLRTVRKELGLKPMELFATIDDNRSGVIEREQFVDVICRLDLDTTADEASLVFDHFDVDGTGTFFFFFSFFLFFFFFLFRFPPSSC